MPVAVANSAQVIERCDRERSRHAPHRHLQRIKQPVENIRALDHVAHEQEQRHRGQHVVRHHVIGIGDEQVENARAHRVVAEEDAHRHEREGDREAQQNDDDEGGELDHPDFGIGEHHRDSPHVHFFFDTPAIRRFGENGGFHFFHVMQPLRPHAVANADDAADDLREALQQHQNCRDRDQRLVRIDRRAGRAVDADFVDVPGLLGIRDAVIEQRAETRQHENDEEDEIDRGLHPVRPHPIDEVAAHMPVARQRIGAGHHEQRAIHEIADVERPVGRRAQQVAHEHIVAGAERHDDDAPAERLADARAQTVDKKQKIFHGGLSRFALDAKSPGRLAAPASSVTCAQTFILPK